MTGKDSRKANPVPNACLEHTLCCAGTAGREPFVRRQGWKAGGQGEADSQMQQCLMPSQKVKTKPDTLPVQEKPRRTPVNLWEERKAESNERN